ncbi:unnamed protein product [Calypogeia fissa]
MVNCGGPPGAHRQQEMDRDVVLETGEWKMGVDATISAISEAFYVEINLKQFQDEGKIVMLLSGPLASLERLCGKASLSVDEWNPWQLQKGSVILSVTDLAKLWIAGLLFAVELISLTCRSD